MMTSGNLIEIGALLLTALFAWRTDASALKLKVGGTHERLHRKMRNTLTWTAMLIICITTSALGGLLKAMAQSNAAISTERLTAHLSLIVVPALCILGCSLPRLLWLWVVSGKRSGALESDILHQAAHPLLLVPLRAAAWCAIAAAYYPLTAPAHSSPGDFIGPVLVLGLIVAALANVQTQRWVRLLKEATTKSAAPGRTWKLSWRMLDALIVFGALSAGGIMLIA